jgi:transcriptional regulator with XRE-family HTH domain
MKNQDNGQKLRALINATGLTQAEALRRFNLRQARPLSIGQWKAYLAKTGSVRRSPCPDNVIRHAEKIFKSNH